jgi:phage I-like protein
MRVRKVRNEDRVGKITLSASEVELAKRMGISVEKYAKNRLVQIAKERRWKWFFKEKS